MRTWLDVSSSELEAAQFTGFTSVALEAGRAQRGTDLQPKSLLLSASGYGPGLVLVRDLDLAGAAPAQALTRRRLPLAEPLDFAAGLRLEATVK